jgi:predicted amidohydrolase YtcJ
MKRISRGEFLGYGAALAGAGAAATSGLEAFVPAQAQPSSTTPLFEADLIVVNARVYTIDPARPRAEAFAVKDGRFIAVGSTADIRNLAGARTRVVDAGGQTVTPGFIDTHCHVSGVGELYSVNANLPRVRELQAALKAKADKTPAGQWVEGIMFDDTKLDVVLTKRFLDEVTRDHPLVVNHRGGHTSWYNSKAFEMAGVTKDTADPDHGRFFRDESGEHTGRVAELARNVFAKVGTRETFTPEQQRERGRNGMRHISELLTAAGLTSVHDAGANRDRIQAYEDARANGELRHRAGFLARGADTFAGFKAAGIHYGFGDEWIRVVGVKYAADGSASERTMRMSTPYVGTRRLRHPHDGPEGDRRGGRGRVAPQLPRRHPRQRRRDHRHGAEGVRARAEAVAAARPAQPHRALLAGESRTCWAASRPPGSSPTPFWTYAHYHGEKWKEYGDEKMNWMFAHKSFLDYGIRVPGASDYGPGPFEPLMAIQSMVTRKDFDGNVWGPKQRVTVDEALTIATINGAYASHEEHVKGSITAGKYADFVVLAKDPHDVNPDEIKTIPIVRTVVGGKTMYPKGEA